MGIYNKDGKGSYTPLNPLAYQGGGYSSQNGFGVTRKSSQANDNFANYSRQTLDILQPGLADRVDKMNSKMITLASNKKVPLIGNQSYHMPQTDRTL